MKKIFVLGIFLNVLFSCSNDNQLENYNPENDTKTTLGLKTYEYNTIFEEYINSQEYIVYNEALIEFTSLLNYQGNLYEINSIDKLDSYIQSNLENTNFLSHSQYIAKISKILELREILNQTSAYINFKELVLSTDLITLQDYFSKWFGSNTATNADCKENYKNCNDDVTSQYANTMAETLEKEKDGSISSKDAHNTYVTAELALKIGREQCDNTFKDCITKK